MFTTCQPRGEKATNNARGIYVCACACACTVQDNDSLEVLDGRTTQSVLNKAALQVINVVNAVRWWNY